LPAIPQVPPGPVPERVEPSRPCTEFQYAVKLVQGQPPPLADLSFIAPGRYFTAINIHNPSTCKTVTFRWKVRPDRRRRPARVDDLPFPSSDSAARRGPRDRC